MANKKRNSETVNDYIEDAEVVSDGGTSVHEDDGIVEVEPVEVRVSEWLERVNLENLEPCMYIYRIDEHNSRKRTLCGRFQGEEIPDEHTAGLTYGPGNYLAVLTIPKSGKTDKKQTSFRFYIDPYYEHLRKTAIQTGTMPVIGAMVPRMVQGTGNNGGNEVVMFKEALSVVSELLGKMQISQQQPQIPDFSGMLMAQYQGISQMMQDNLLNTNNMMLQTVKNNLKNIETQGVESENDDTELSLIEKWLPKAVEMLPMLLANPATGAILKTVLKSVIGNGTMPKKPPVHSQDEVDKETKFKILKEKIRTEVRKEIIAEIKAKQQLKKATEEIKTESNEAESKEVK